MVKRRPRKKGRARVKLSWLKRDQCWRCITVRDGIHLQNLYETLGKAPGVLRVELRTLRKGERSK